MEKIRNINVPPFAGKILSKLEKAGFESYVVGGCVRDSLMGEKPNDWDVCTAACPDEIKKVFAGYKLITAGEKHGTIAILNGGECVEATTFRTENGYSDMRRPDKVSFIKDIVEDLKRRDFTVNAMAASPKRGFKDPFGGEADIKAQIIRCVGDPYERFNEDAFFVVFIRIVLMKMP